MADGTAGNTVSKQALVDREIGHCNVLSVWRIGWLFSLLSLLLLHAGMASAAADGYSIAQAPDWVNPVSLNYPSAMAAEASGGTDYLLAENQINVVDESIVRYRRFTEWALNGDGVERASKITIDFHPSYETLTLHTIEVIRNNKHISKLASATINLIQQEKDLDYQIYDGSKTLVAILDDIRVGDIVEYSFSISGSNPAFNNKFVGGFDVQWAVPVEKIYTRLLWPEQRPLKIKNHAFEIEPVTTNHHGVIEYEWLINKQVALDTDSDLPYWYQPYPWVQLSEFSDWREVIDWAVALYAPAASLNHDLAKLIKGIKGSAQTPEQRLLKALAFAQNEIRYMGIEIGSGSYIPSPPSAVLQRRFGDCKDKSMLLITMLKELGIDAAPVLVNTRIGKGITEYLPTPTAFNHVIVRAHLNGSDYWLDPTRSYQSGSLENLFQPNYDVGLPVSNADADLVEMAQAGAIRSKKVINDEYDLRGGVAASAGYKVSTTYEGHYADRMRRTLATTQLTKLQKDYLEFYAGYYPSIAVSSEMLIEDDPNANRLTVSEFYTIADFWYTEEDAPEVYQVDFHPAEFYPLTNVSASNNRSMPLSVEHPIDMQQSTTVMLPEAWSIDQEQLQLTDSAFEYAKTVEYRDETLYLGYHYKTVKDHVDVENIKEHLANVTAMDDGLGYGLYWNTAFTAEPDWKEEVNYPIALISLLLLMVFSVVAFKLYRFNPAGETDEEISHPLHGLRGWLILVGIGMVISPFSISAAIISLAPSYALTTWNAVTTAGSDAYHVMFAPLLLMELTFNLFILVASILLILLFFNKRRSFPKLYIIFLIVTTIVGMADHYLSIGFFDVEVEPSEEIALFASAFVTMLWVIYFVVSKRVKATFVMDWKPSVKGQSSGE